MAYSTKAEDLRRCTHRFPEGHQRAGERCRAYALWESPWRQGKGLCSAHAGHTRGPDRRAQGKPWKHHRAVPKCHCRAYQWPHRPGGGLCRWPDPPLYRSTIEAGTHAPIRRPAWLGPFFGIGVEIERTTVDVELHAAGASAPESGKTT